MNNSIKFALAFGLAIAMTVPQAFSQQAPAAATSTVIKPVQTAPQAAPAAASRQVPAPAMSSAIASTPPAMPSAPAAAAPAASAAAQPSADIRLPAPTLTVPSSPPVVAAAPQPAKPAVAATAAARPANGNVVLTTPVGAGKAQPAAQADAAAKQEKPAKPVRNAARDSKKKAEEAEKAAAAEKAKEPARKFSFFKKKEQPANVAAKVAPGEVVARTRPKFMFGLFDAPKPEEEVLSPDQVAYDQKLAAVPDKKKFKVKEEFVPVTVPFKGYKPGTIVIDTRSKYLYFVESPATAVRYAVAVGKEGLLFTGKATVGAKQPWPRWIPTKEMIERDPKKYGKYADGMDGGPDNPLGARAIYLYQGKQDTYLRIHGTNQPQTIGTASSNGCFRMINEHVIDLYKRVGIGAEVVVL